MAYDADLDSTFNPSVGGTPTAAYLEKVNDNFATLGGAWTSFTPTWTATTANPSIGNGTISGAYMQAGKLLTVRYYILMGATTTYGTGQWELAIPNSLTVSTSHTQTGSALIYDSGTGFYVGTAFTGSLLANNRFRVITNGAQGVGPTSPMTWATGDVLAISALIELA